MTPRTALGASRRRGYTLLEVLIASVIGLLLLGALYATFDLVLRQSSGGRELTAESELSRAIISRVGLDLTSTVGTLAPKSGQAGATSSTGSTSTAAASTDSSTTDSSMTSTATNTPFQSGIVGVDTQVMLFVSRLPKYLRQRFATYDPAAVDPGDLVRVTYYLHSSGKGLCRQERPWVTADGVWNSTDPDRTTEDGDVIAPEVSSLTFEYASGTSYASTWDGSVAATDGTTNQGPPRAVRMTFELEFFVPDGGNGPKSVKKTYVHVYPIRAAVGLAVSPSTAAATSSASTSP